MSIHNQERLLTVVLRPVISEKATMVADKQKQGVFEVLRDATKQEIKAAVASRYGRVATTPGDKFNSCTLGRTVSTNFGMCSAKG